MPFVLAFNQVRSVVDGPGTLPSVSFGSFESEAGGIVPVIEEPETRVT
jgi:hypothetical protein